MALPNRSRWRPGSASTVTVHHGSVLGLSPSP
jgi:hypothetical protein